MKTQLLALALMAPMALLAAPAAQAQAGQTIAGLDRAHDDGYAVLLRP